MSVPVRLFLVAFAGLAAATPGALADGRCGPNRCRADVSISGHAEPQPIHVGETSVLKVTPKNDGYDGTTGIDTQIFVNEGLKIVSVKRYGGRSCTRKGSFVRCDFGPFRREQEGVVRVKVRATKLGFSISKAVVYSDGVDDPNGGNNQVSMTVGVIPR